MISGTITDIATFEKRVNLETGGIGLFGGEGYTGHTGPVTVNLGNAPIRDGAFTGDVTLSPRSGVSADFITSSGGAWGGRFSTSPASDTDSDPRLVGGTFAAHGIVGSDNRAQWVGAFSATKQ